MVRFTTSTTLLLTLVSAFVTFKAVKALPLQNCKEECLYGDLQRGVLICRNGINYCLEETDEGKRGDVCGCCETYCPSQPTAEPTRKPRTRIPTRKPRTFRPTRAPRTMRPTEKPRTARPRTARPTRRPLQLAPVNQPQKCERDFQCTDRVFCDIPGKVPPAPYIGICACDKDIEGNPFCWQNVYCTDLFQNKCEKNSDCKDGSKCVPDGTCCGSGGNYCMHECFNPGEPYKPDGRRLQDDKRNTTLLDGYFPCNISSTGFCPLQ